jgi:1-deoxy-D-xylulose-5-phosphate reductoisomerase
MERGGNVPCILNASNEITVHAFLGRRISFNDIARINEECMREMDYIGHPGLEDYLESDRKTRALALKKTEKTGNF